MFKHLQKLDNKAKTAYEDGLVIKAYLVKKQFKSVARLNTAFHPHFTLHDTQHSDSVLKNIHQIAHNARLLEPSNAFSLTRFEVYYLIAAAYLHDVGMLYAQPDDRHKADEKHKSVSEIIRLDHHLRSVAYIEQHRDRLNLEQDEAKILGLVCKGHRVITDLEAVEYEPIPAPDGTWIRLRLLASLLRIADELDLDHHRAPENQRKLLEFGDQLDEISRLHWMKHYYTQGVGFGFEVKDERMVKVYVTLLVPDEKHREFMSSTISEEFHKHLYGVEKETLRNGFRVQLVKPIDFRIDPNMKTSVCHPQDLHILYVDDEPLIRQQVEHELKKKGFQCDLALDTNTALEKIDAVMNDSKITYHQVVLDMEMPDKNNISSNRAGADLLNHVRRLVPDALVTIFTQYPLLHGENDRLFLECRQQGATIIYKDKGIGYLVEQITKSLQSKYILK